MTGYIPVFKKNDLPSGQACIRQIIKITQGE